MQFPTQMWISPTVRKPPQRSGFSWVASHDLNMGWISSSLALKLSLFEKSSEQSGNPSFLSQRSSSFPSPPSTLDKSIPESSAWQHDFGPLLNLPISFLPVLCPGLVTKLYFEQLVKTGSDLRRFERKIARVVRRRISIGERRGKLVIKLVSWVYSAEVSWRKSKSLLKLIPWYRDLLWLFKNLTKLRNSLNWSLTAYRSTHIWVY